MVPEGGESNSSLNGYDISSGGRIYPHVLWRCDTRICATTAAVSRLVEIRQVTSDIRHGHFRQSTATKAALDSWVDCDGLAANEQSHQISGIVIARYRADGETHAFSGPIDLLGSNLNCHLGGKQEGTDRTNVGSLQRQSPTLKFFVVTPRTDQGLSSLSKRIPMATKLLGKVIREVYTISRFYNCGRCALSPRPCRLKDQHGSLKKARFTHANFKFKFLSPSC